MHVVITCQVYVVLTFKSGLGAHWAGTLPNGRHSPSPRKFFSFLPTKGLAFVAQLDLAFAMELRLSSNSQFPCLKYITSFFFLILSLLA